MITQLTPVSSFQGKCNRNRTSGAVSTPVKDVNCDTNGSAKELEDNEIAVDYCETPSSINDAQIVSPSPTTSDKKSKQPRDRKRDRKDRKEKKTEIYKPVTETQTVYNGSEVDMLEICR